MVCIYNRKDENAVYNATIVNMTADSSVIYGYLYDEYGEQLNYQSIYNDGKPVSLSSEELTPNTTYYIYRSISMYRLFCDCKKYQCRKKKLIKQFLMY